MSIRYFLLSLLVVWSASICAQPSEKDIAKLSETLGHIIKENMNTLGIQVDIHAVIKGMQDSSEGKTSPMSETEWIEAISFVQQENLQKLAQENLQKAESFLKKNALNKDVLVLQEGRLQYKMEKTGMGLLIEPSSNIIVRYVGKYADGSIFFSSQDEEHLSLEEVIPGLKQGLAKMREGEKGTLYIHPDYAYGTQGVAPPNSLLIFDIEVIKVHPPSQTESQSLAKPHSEQ